MSGEEGVKAPVKRAALGRGLGALLGETRREESLVRPAPAATGGAPAATAPARATTGVALLSVAEIEPHPDQPRRHFDEEALDELAQSIAARGVIQPVIVRPMAGGRYQLVAGERRWRAAQRARVHEIPAIVRQLDEREVTALALIENLQREDLNPVEEARAYQRLSDNDGLTQQEIARFVDKSRSHVANLMRLLSLPEEVLDMVQRDDLSMGHARALAVVPDPLPLAQEIIAKGLSVRDAERMAKRATKPESGPRRARAERDPSDSADIAAVQAHVEEFLGLKVTINADADPRTGNVVIRYKTLDQLDLICQRLTGGAI
ncbi:ParB family chromosome partitioning protein [Novosphingobium capsulatum]|uniref:ParB family chromosome partitioning protein n=2 Tax=Novosphingobium TaxID=165696 RepID=A0ABU1MKG7_9SPHN|nr:MULTISPECIES: ParB/RepB/Spo0J family partition protein [Novosphingobium]MBB3359233.1 ParB family chromosome partitioning protein [Novosphingobium sp. BK256]MBB3375286.1 ParB family chromosome partitioning protein [Novosphingobium sp. BK280]MBB3380006.1 ParB family chromosome partitioning protein [Novosphingobium sp. BK258]MBB3421700.1 ParB family chromosome partitioning protein [Novosphingobium sp. BK267]MBB3450015.1 ParB family chromosome partitioning protein [Novosphingobium sp. BK352]